MAEVDCRQSSGRKEGSDQVKRNYTMTKAALKQRRAAAKNRKSEGDMTVARVSVANRDFATINYGSVNRAITHLREASAECNS